MKTLSIRIFKKVIPALLLAIVSFTANAQKLPNVQKDAVLAPADVKTDGRATEWDNKFQAYNHATDVYYTLANNNDNLYLTIQAPDPVIIRKILNGGITFTINQYDKKTDKDGINITYPFFDKGNKMIVDFRNKPEITPGSQASVKLADSFMYVNNTLLGNKAKQVKVIGIKTLDTLISVYNEDGIKAVALFDNKMVYTYELSVSLKNLGMSVNNPVEFAYNVRINAVESQGIIIKKDDSGTIMSINITKGAQAGQEATDFWGEYTLAKK